MKRFLFVMFAALSLAVVFVSCCACRKGKNNKPLTGTEWHLVRMMSGDLSIKPDQFVFAFGKDGNFSGVGACNRMMGSYTATEKGGMTFGGDMASTRMMCPDIELESKFAEILSTITHYEIDGDMLMLLSNGEVRAILKAVAPSAESK